MEIGFIGLGNMGQPIARNLLAAGHEVEAYNRTRARAEGLRGDGARVADTPAAAGAHGVVVTMLSDDLALEETMFGAGVQAAMRPGAIHLSMSTISTALAERLSVAHADAGQRFVSAPVLGRPDMAAAGRLFIVAAGDPGAVAECEPLLDAIGQRTFVVGERPVAANMVKLANNFLLVSAIEALGEAFALLRKSGTDPGRFLEMITATNFAAPAYKVYGNIIAKEAYEPAGFELRLGLKDVTLALEAAAAENVPMPFASAVRDTFMSAVARGHGGKDWAAIAEVLAENAGLGKDRD